MFAQLKQALAVVEFSLATIWSRISVTLVGVLAIASVSLVLVAVLAASVGFQRAYRGAGASDVLICMKASATSELGSNLDAEETGSLREAISSALGTTPLISEESYFVTQVQLKSRPVEVNVPVRGLGVPGMRLRQGFHITQGRMNRPGIRELIVGERATRDYAGLMPGSTVNFGNSQWTVVGVFSSDNEVSNSEIWGDDVLLPRTYLRDGTVQSVYVVLPNPQARFAVERSIAKDKRLQLQTRTEAEYYASLSRAQAVIISAIGYLMASGMGIVAVVVLIGGMHASVSARARQIGILRAIGFSATPLFVSVLFETVLVALCGGTLGALLAFGLFDGIHLSTLNVAGGFTQVPFSLLVNLQVIGIAAGFSGLLGLVAGLLPAWGAARPRQCAPWVAADSGRPG